MTLTGSLSVFKSGSMNQAVARSVSALLFNMTGTHYVANTLSVLTSATVIPLGGVTTPAWCFAVNLDATNFLRLMNGAAGAKVVKLKPGECAFFPWDDTATPYAIADSATCLLDYLIFDR